MQQLLNPFAQKYPESVDTTLPTDASSLSFNPYGPYAGHYLAVGGIDGPVEIWDAETRGVVRILQGHVRPVGSVKWSRNNKYLLSGSLDGLVIIWDLAILNHLELKPVTPITEEAGPSSPSSTLMTDSRKYTIRFDAPVISANFHPRNSKIILVVFSTNEVILVDLRNGASAKRHQMEDIMEGEEDGAVEEGNGEGDGAQRKRSSLACAAFSPCGSRIYAGTTGGVLLVIDPMSKYVLQRVKVANAAIRKLAFDSAGRHLLLSSSDRALRLLAVSPSSATLTPLTRFQDLVNRTPWHSIGFSGDGEYVMGGAGHKVAHNVFVWDRDSTTLIKVLEGPRESLVDCDWHPTRPVIASISTSGETNIWQTSQPDNWAAFAPGFEELEENVEYDEREDEFDIEDESELNRRKDLEEDIFVDVLKQQDDQYPQIPQPLNGNGEGEGIEESESERYIRSTRQVAQWADQDPDDDTWQGFYLSLDLLEDVFDDQIQEGT